MDGTLLDTETPARAAFARAISDVGFDYRAEVYDRCIGTSHAKTEEILTSAYGERYDHVALHNSWSQRFNEHTRVHPIEVKPGVVAVLERLSEYSIPLAIATSNRREVCNQHLLEAGLLGFFQHFVCADEAGRTKPAPDPYLLAVHKLNVAAEVSWAVEDSHIGVLAAAQAGPKGFSHSGCRQQSGRFCADRAEGAIEYGVGTTGLFMKAAADAQLGGVHALHRQLS